MEVVLNQNLPVFTEPVMRLPLRFDTERLREEVSSLIKLDWLQHPQDFTGNFALPLIAVNGQYNHSFGLSGQMYPTPALQLCPYLTQVIAHFNIKVSRTRLMLLAAGRHVTNHFDAGYHWYRRLRIHVPIFTHPDVHFSCGGKTVNMKAGEAWCFDHRQWHSVKNNSPFSRIHLVIDAMVNPDFLSSFDEITYPSKPLPYEPNKFFPVKLEPYRFQVLEPHELASLLTIIQAELAPQVDIHAANDFTNIKKKWNEAFTKIGHEIRGEAVYADIIENVKSLVDATTLSARALSAYTTIITMLSKDNGEPKKCPLIEINLPPR